MADEEWEDRGGYVFTSPILRDDIIDGKGTIQRVPSDSINGNHVFSDLLDRNVGSKISSPTNKIFSIGLGIMDNGELSRQMTRGFGVVKQAERAQGDSGYSTRTLPSTNIKGKPRLIDFVGSSKWRSSSGDDYVYYSLANESSYPGDYLVDEEQRYTGAYGAITIRTYCVGAYVHSWNGASCTHFLYQQYYYCWDRPEDKWYSNASFWAPTLETDVQMAPGTYLPPNGMYKDSPYDY